MSDFLYGALIAKFFLFFLGSPLRIFLTIVSVSTFWSVYPSADTNTQTQTPETTQRPSIAAPTELFSEHTACIKEEKKKFWVSVGVLNPDCDQIVEEIEAYYAERRSR